MLVPAIRPTICPGGALNVGTHSTASSTPMRPGLWFCVAYMSSMQPLLVFSPSLSPQTQFQSHGLPLVPAPVKISRPPKRNRDETSAIRVAIWVALLPTDTKNMIPRLSNIFVLVFKWGGEWVGGCVSVSMRVRACVFGASVFCACVTAQVAALSENRL